MAGRDWRGRTGGLTNEENDLGISKLRVWKEKEESKKEENVNFQERSS